MSDGKVLTKEIAEQFLADENSLDLSEFTAIEDDAAEVLGRINETHGIESLELGGLDSISSVLMSHLLSASVTIYFDGIETMTNDIACAIEGDHHASLAFLSVCKIEDDLLRVLGKYSGPGLYLGFECLSDSQAEIFSTFMARELGLRSVSDLSHAAAANLSNYAGVLQMELLLLPMELRQILRSQQSIASWGEVETYAEPICKYCGSKGRIFVPSDITPHALLSGSNRQETEGWTWNICPQCTDGFNEQEIQELMDSDA